MRNRWSAGVLMAVVAVGCGGNRTGEEVERRAALEVEVAPGDSLPAAVLGAAPAPRGVAVQYFPADPATRGYLAVPEGPGPFPAVILIHEWDGVNDRIRQVADALAGEGCVALAADLYSGRTGRSPEENRALVAEVSADQARIIANLDAAARFLRERRT